MELEWKSSTPVPIVYEMDILCTHWCTSWWQLLKGKWNLFFQDYGNYGRFNIVHAHLHHSEVGLMIMGDLPAGRGSFSSSRAWGVGGTAPTSGGLVGSLARSHQGAVPPVQVSPPLLLSNQRGTSPPSLSLSLYIAPIRYFSEYNQ